MSERCSTCKGSLVLMCDSAFAETADRCNEVGQHYTEAPLTMQDPGSVLDFVAFCQSSAFKGLRHTLKGYMGYGCTLTDEEIAQRIRNTQEYRIEMQNSIDKLGSGENNGR